MLEGIDWHRLLLAKTMDVHKNIAGLDDYLNCQPEARCQLKRY
jgi:hypothetical protein